MLDAITLTFHMEEYRLGYCFIFCVRACTYGAQKTKVNFHEGAKYPPLLKEMYL